jgi:O-antigen/teichoic acid export membrane protein
MTHDAEEVDRSSRTDGATVVRSMTVTAAGHLAGQVAWFGSLVVLGTLLEPVAFGVVAAGLVIVNSGILLMGAGTGGSIISTRALAAGEIRSSIRLNLLLGTAMSAGLFLLADPITERFASGGDPSVLRWLSLAIALHAVTVVPIALLRRQMQFGRSAMATFGAYTVAGLVAVTIGLFGGGVWALVVRIIAYEGLLAVLALVFARALLRDGGRRIEDDAGTRRTGGSWFFLLALADFVAFNADYLIVGRYTGAARLGLYSFAFLLAFAPLRQFSWQIGSVLFSASAATYDPIAVRQKLSTALRIGAGLLLPVAVPAILLAPVVIPAVLGSEWEPMVTTFQVLIGTGIAHAVLNIGAEFLSGSGHIDLRARLSVVWATAMVVSLLVVVPRHGILGAACVHATLFIPFAVATSVLGARRLGIRLVGVIGSLWPGISAAIAQVGIAVAVSLALQPAHASGTWTAVIASLLGLCGAAIVLSLGKQPPLPEIGRLVRSAVRRPTTAGPA